MYCQATPVFLPGKPQGQRSLVGYNPWGCRESDTAERLDSNNGAPNRDGHEKSGVFIGTAPQCLLSQYNSPVH